MFYGSFARLVDKVDTSWFDNVNVLVYRWTDRLGRGVTQAQTGQLQIYGIVSALGVGVALLFYLVLD